MSPTVIEIAAGRRLSRGSAIAIVTLGSWLVPLLVIRLAVFVWGLLS